MRPLAVGASIALCLLVCASPAAAALVFKHPNGAAIHFPGSTQVWCGPWEEGVARPSVHVVAGNGRAHWEISAVRRDVKLGRPIEFPNSFVHDRPHGAFLFVGVARSGIEASSAEGEGSGSLVFSRLDCQLGGAVEFRVRATLGSELFDGERVKVSGTFSGEVAEPPPFAQPG
jgi:hypothetical protein